MGFAQERPNEPTLQYSCTCLSYKHSNVGLDRNPKHYHFPCAGLIIVSVLILPFKPSRNIIPNRFSTIFAAVTRPEKRENTSIKNRLFPGGRDFKRNIL